MAKATYTNTQAAHLVELVIDAPKMGMNNKVIGRAQRVANTTNFGTQNVYEIGSMMPKESVPLRFEGSVTVDNLLIRFDSLASEKPDGINGSPADSLGADVLEKYTFDIVIRDKMTKHIVRKYEDCTIASSNEELTANALFASSATFFFLTSTADEGYLNASYSPNDEETVYNRLGSGGTSNPISNASTSVVHAATSTAQHTLGGVIAHLTQ